MENLVLIWLVLNGILLWNVFRPYSGDTNRFLLFARNGAISISAGVLINLLVVPMPAFLRSISFYGACWVQFSILAYGLRCLYLVTQQSQSHKVRLVSVAKGSLSLGLLFLIVVVGLAGSALGYQAGCLNPFMPIATQQRVM